MRELGIAVFHLRYHDSLLGYLQAFGHTGIDVQGLLIYIYEGHLHQNLGLSPVLHFVEFTRLDLLDQVPALRDGVYSTFCVPQVAGQRTGIA